MSKGNRKRAVEESDNDRWEGGPAPARNEVARTPIFIVASPRQQVGKTFVARLALDFLALDAGEALGFDLNPGAGGLAAHRPRRAVRSDISDLHGQMALFDRLVADDGVAKVVDIGSAAYERFFDIALEIGFFTEAVRRALEPVILYAADPHPDSVAAYARLRGRFELPLLVPVFNEAIVKGQRLREFFPVRRAAAVPLQIPELAPSPREHAERSAHSFADFHEKLPVDIPIGAAFELRSWARRAFLEFRELELRLLLEKLKSSLAAT